MPEEKTPAQMPPPHEQHAALPPHRIEPRPSLYSSALAIVGFIILIVIVLWGLFHIATLASPFFSSLFNNSSASIQITAPSSTKSGEPFTMSWKYSTSEKGTYALLYQCKNDFRFEIADAEGRKNSIPCGAAHAMPTANNKITMTPILMGSASTSIPVSIIFLPSATTSKSVQGNATVTIIPSAVAASTQPAPVVSVSSAPRVAGPADLSARIMRVSVDPSGMAVAEFDIANEGGSPSGAYYFEAFLPTQSAYTYTSPLQSSLGAGDHIISTLRFTQAMGGTVSIVVDPTNMVSESNENNNYASQPIAMPYYTPHYTQPYPYQQYPQQYQAPYVY